MNCPRCNSSMIILEFDRVEIDFCPECKGIWLDSGELELLISKDHPSDPFLSSIEFYSKSKELKLKCPVCSKKMKKVRIGFGNKIVLDKCGKDHGFWFDKGELEKTLESADAAGESKVISILKEMFANNN